MTPTAKSLILKRLEGMEGSGYLAVHELHIQGVSDNAAATRLSELAKAGLIEGRVRPGAHFKEWRIKVMQRPVYTYDSRGQGQLWV